MSTRNWFYHFNLMMVYVGSCVNPFIYAAKYGEFQTGVRRMVARVTGKPLQVEGSVQNTGARVVSNPAYQRSTAGTAVRHT